MRIVSVHAHFWDVFLERPVSHHSRAFQRKWGQDSNLAIVKCWISFVWSVLLLIYSCVLDHRHVEWPNFFWVSDHKQTLWHSAPDITRNSLVPQWLQAVQTLRQQNSTISLHSHYPQSFTAAMMFWQRYGEFCVLFIYFRYIKNI